MKRRTTVPTSKMPTLRTLYAQRRLKSPLDRIALVRGDITTLEVDAIVNAAKHNLQGGGGVDGAIHRAAGPSLLQECKALNGCETGEAKITRGYNLPAKYVIHTVGPVYDVNDKDNKAKQLAACYHNSLNLAASYHVKTIAFPSISTGVYGYPLEDAVRIALRIVRRFIATQQADEIDLIVFNVFSDDVMRAYLRIIPDFFPNPAS